MNQFIQRTRKLVSDSTGLSLGYRRFNELPEGISYRGDPQYTNASFLYDITYADDAGVRRTEQQIFDEVFKVIKQARKLLVIDLFLFNDFQGAFRESTRQLSRELTEVLLVQHAKFPDLEIFFITDPINTIYGGTRNLYIDRLREAGIAVIISDIDQLRDSNPIYSFFWRLFVRPFGNKPGGIIKSPFNEDQISIRSYLKLFNLKANHRKSIIADDGRDDWVGFVATANPHDGSSAHRNVAVRFNGLAVLDLFITELAVLKMASVTLPTIEVAPKPAKSRIQIQVVTEKKIKDAVLKSIRAAERGDEIRLILFYLSDRTIIRSLREARRRGVEVKLILDINTDAFGRQKIGIPNRPVAHDLRKNDIEVRWANTHGEQCHSKMMLVHYQGGDSKLILGSANFTRRNLDDFNLETDVVVTAAPEEEIIRDASNLHHRLWNNEDNRNYTLEYERYRDAGRFRYAIYWLMEKTGISTF